MACVAVLSLMRTLELEFLQPQPRPVVQQNELISCNNHLVQSLHEKLGPLMEQFDENRMDGVEAIKKLETKLRDVAFRTEDEIELQVVELYGEELEGEEEELLGGMAGLFEAEEGNLGSANLHGEKASHSSKLGCILEEAIQDIDAIKEELLKVKNVIALQGRKTTLDATPKFDELVKMDSSSKHASHSEDIMVGKDNEFQKIKEMLIEHPSKQRQVVSIQGMGGIGKTTLARRVYEDPSISSHFDKRAWAVASQHHNKRQMLIDLLNLNDNNAEGFSDEELTERLYRSLKCQRYLVVMDDIWSKEAWDTLNTCFPDDGNGSRVLLTTRIAEVANHTISNNDFFHQVHLLNQSESWSLFHRKACKSRGAEFKAIGRPIVKKCKGLPLAILVVAGLFSKLETLDEWKNTAEDLNSSATTIDDECLRILSSSYNHLPYNLKACFLYLGIFPEDEQIYVTRLVKLWAAEGLVKASENLSFDEIAKRHIQELKDRNLILVSRLSRCGRKIKAFRMHDLLHSFCVKEAQKENLLHVVYENGSNSPLKGYFRWVSFQSKKYDKNFSLKNCRSILCFKPTLTRLNLKCCNLVRVLYEAEYWFKNLVHLRFLFSSFLDVKKPLHAWNLQTLCTRNIDEVNFLEFPQLQHFGCDNIPSDSAVFFHQKLKSIYWMQPCQCTKELVTNIPYLKKVKIMCGETPDWNDCIKNLAYLHQLQDLHIFCLWSLSLPTLRMDPHNNHIVLLKNLKKLYFECMYIECKAINVLSKLPVLEVLKLESFWGFHGGEEWKLPEEETFGQLIYLEIKISYLKRWEANAYHFPKLEHLLIIHCKELEEIPADFAEIPKLKSIKFKGCLPSAVASAKRIQEEQRDYGNVDMVVIEQETIQPKGSNKDEE